MEAQNNQFNLKAILAMRTKMKQTKIYRELHIYVSIIHIIVCIQNIFFIPSKLQTDLFTIELPKIGPTYMGKVVLHTARTNIHRAWNLMF